MAHNRCCEWVVQLSVEASVLCRVKVSPLGNVYFKVSKMSRWLNQVTPTAILN